MPTKDDRTAGPVLANLKLTQPIWDRRNDADSGWILLSRPTRPVVTSRATHVTLQVQE